MSHTPSTDADASQTRDPESRTSSPGQGTPDPGVRVVAEALQSAGIDYMMIRGWETPDPGEVDVLIRPGTFDRVAATLKPYGFARVLGPGRGSHRFLVRYDTAAGRWLKLDTVTEMAFGARQEIPGADADDLLRRADTIGGIRLIGRGDRLWATLLHRFGDPRTNGRTGELHDVDLRALGEDADLWSPLAELFLLRSATSRHAGGPAGGPATVIDLARGGRTPEIGAFTRAALARVRSRRAWLVAQRIIHHDMRHILRRMQHATTFPPRRGLVVALLGPDGAGKSGLALSMAMSSPLPVRRAYMGLYQSTAPPQRPRRRRFSGLNRLRTVVSISIHSWLDRRRGRVVVLDRHVYDLLMRGGSRRAQLRRAVYLRAGIRPDVTIVLDAPPEILHERRQEQSIDEAAAERARYRRIAVAIPGALIVDASQPLRDVAGSVTTIIWDRLTDESGEVG